MLKFWSFLFFLIVSIGQATFAQNQSFHSNISLAFHSKPFLGLQNDLMPSDKGILKFNIKYDTDNSASQLALNYDGYDNLNLDRSYLQYTSGIATFGVGAIDRQWSFSNKTSLILSHNARPIKSIYLKLRNGVKYDWLPSVSNWSLEVFNGLTKSSLNNGKSMLFGTRAILSPVEGLDFELVQTSQWGGKGYNTDISAITATLITDTNTGNNSNINKMAGLGFSLKISNNMMPLRIYSQAIGEDEAGNFPSCYAYMAGLEWVNTKIKYPTTVSIETIDTRVDYSTYGSCGPNTVYNNNIYKYINYGKTMGAAIDTEGTSLDVHLRSQISKKITINFSTKSIVINDNNWPEHRLSSKRQSGLINSLGISWVKDKISFSGNIYNQGFDLNKANIKSGYGVGFSSSIIF